MELKYGGIYLDIEEWHREHREVSALIRTVTTLLNVIISAAVAVKVFDLI